MSKYTFLNKNCACLSHSSLQNMYPVTLYDNIESKALRYYVYLSISFLHLFLEMTTEYFNCIMIRSGHKYIWEYANFLGIPKKQHIANVRIYSCKVVSDLINYGKQNNWRNWLRKFQETLTSAIVNSVSDKSFLAVARSLVIQKCTECIIMTGNSILQDQATSQTGVVSCAAMIYPTRISLRKTEQRDAASRKMQGNGLFKI